jgi:hypothetical protein
MISSLKRPSREKLKKCEPLLLDEPAYNKHGEENMPAMASLGREVIAVRIACDKSDIAMACKHWQGFACRH